MMYSQNCMDNVAFYYVLLGDLNDGFHLMLEITGNDTQWWDL